MRVAILALLVAVSSCEEKKAGDSGSGSLDVCIANCLAVPTGIKGLSFGMTLAQAKEALGGKRLSTASAKRIHATRKRAKQVPRKLHRAARRKAIQRLPGTVAKVRTTLGTERAECRLEFAVDSRLSSIRCTIASTRKRNRYASVYKAIRTRLEARHGLGKERGAKLRWEDHDAVLVLEGHPNKRGAIALLNRSAAHEALVNDSIALADKVYDEEIAKAAKAKAEAAKARASKSKEAGKAWDRDLSGSPESGR